MAKPSKQTQLQKTREGYKIYVGNVSFETTQPYLRSQFEKFGSLVDTYIMPPHSGRPTAYAFVTYRVYDDAELAIFKMNGECMHGNVLRVDWAKFTIVPPPSQRGSAPGERYPKFYRYRQVQQALAPTNNAANRYVANRIVKQESVKSTGSKKRFPTDAELGFNGYAAPYPISSPPIKVPTMASPSSDSGSGYSHSDNGFGSDVSSVESFLTVKTPETLNEEDFVAFFAFDENVTLKESKSLPRYQPELPKSLFQKRQSVHPQSFISDNVYVHPQMILRPGHSHTVTARSQPIQSSVPEAQVFESFGRKKRVSQFGAIGMPITAACSKWVARRTSKSE